MAVVTMKEMLESGVHFGHQTRRWNPKMKRFILTERNGLYIIDLHQTLTYIDRAYEFVKETVAQMCARRMPTSLSFGKGSILPSSGAPLKIQQP